MTGQRAFLVGRCVHRKDQISRDRVCPLVKVLVVIKRLAKQ